MTAAYRTDVEGRAERLRLRQTAGRIGAELQFLLEEAVRSPVPEDWLELLRRADERLMGRG